MKIAGKKIEGPNIETIVIPRGNDLDDAIVFKAASVLDFDEFDALCPRPQAPVKMVKGGKTVPDLTRPSYKASIEDYAKKRIAWIVLKSLEATEELVWEQVNIDDPTTWLKFEEELKAAGFSSVECHRIVNGVMSANCLDESKLDKAREDFLASRRVALEELSSQEDELNSTPSGEPASDSE